MSSVTSAFNQNLGQLRALAARGDHTAALLVAMFDDLAAQGKEAVIADFGTTAQKTLSGLSAVDGITPTAGMVCLVNNQTDPTENGLYLAASGTWTRLVDSRGLNVLRTGMLVLVLQGSSLGLTLWANSNTSITVGTTSIAFTQIATGGSPFVNRGAVPSARLKIATAPTNLDTVTIGGHVFKYVTALAAATTFTQIEIGTAAQARTDLADAINGTSNVRVTQATSPFAGLIVADAPVDTDKVRIRAAATRGGTVTAKAKASASVAVSKSLTAVADVWNVANINETGHASGSVASSISSIVITALMIAAGKVVVELPFTPVLFVPYAVTSTGATRAFSDLMTISGDGILITLGGGASPNLQVNDVVTIYAAA